MMNNLNVESSVEGMEEKLEELVEDMFETYIEDGFDFNTDQSLNDIFFMIFNDAVQMTLKVLEENSEEDDD